MAAEIWVVDIETAPMEVYSWSLWNQNHSINQIIKQGSILCFSAVKIGERKPETHSIWDAEGYDGMVERLYEIYNTATHIVGYNTVKFDNKWIRSAFALVGFAPPSPWKDVDLYKIVRANFQFPSYKLEYVAPALGVGEKLKHSGQELWNECLRPSSEQAGEKARKTMVRYCAQDVRVTAALFERLRGWVKNLDLPNYSDGDDFGPRCANCDSSNIQYRGYARTKNRTYRRFQCQEDGCGSWGKEVKSVSGTEGTGI